MTNIEKNFQELYNTLIKNSDRAFLNSQKKEYSGLQSGLQESAFAFEHSANLLDDTCKANKIFLQTTITLRQQAIEEMRREEATGESEEELVQEFENE